LAAAGAAFGAVLGSFIATLTERWPKGRSVSGRSHCEACEAGLTAFELIPLISWLALRGRCRRCGEVIGWRAPLVEGLAAGIGALALLAAPGPVGLTGAVFGWLLLTLAVLDLEHLWLPDRITFALMITGLMTGIALGQPSLEVRLIGAIAGFSSLELVRIGFRAVRGKEGLGGGDPKLFAGIGAWLGWEALPFVLLAASLVGLLAVGGGRLLGQRFDADRPLPFGLWLALASYPFWFVRVWSTFELARTL
jgi:leader peptidase (prepilin peptidase) / N-methyltransferase